LESLSSGADGLQAGAALRTKLCIFLIRIPATIAFHPLFLL